jgi:hypothetical protein
MLHFNQVEKRNSAGKPQVIAGIPAFNEEHYYRQRCA